MSFNLAEVTYDEVYKQCIQLTATKACGVDGMTARLIKSCGDAIESLTFVINLSIKKCEVPRTWKMARVTPLHIGGTMHDRNNYRPISVLPLFSKIMERLIHDRLYGYLDRCQMLSSSQSGFRKAHSTSTCLYDFLNEVYCNIDEGRLIGVAFLNLKKAFDTVDHKILLSKLSKLNISYRTIRWFDSYLRE